MKLNTKVLNQMIGSHSISIQLSEKLMSHVVPYHHPNEQLGLPSYTRVNPNNGVWGLWGCIREVGLKIGTLGHLSAQVQTNMSNPEKEYEASLSELDDDRPLQSRQSELRARAHTESNRVPPISTPDD
ncbi:hypothetical protein H5410_051044 [Solanum commersonii]|uniref:Uncharacterized protein n=1 Tax=Solanum commersonii TaxID=4109 RepID=A0A9J5WX44_SOLCO|nr:hypothetical protein H5410_051044 [Solanum commersonii]